MSDPNFTVEVKVMRSSRKADTYLYLTAAAEYDELPEALRAQFGDATEFLRFELTHQRSLAQVDAGRVIEAIQAQGFFLQLPPAVDQAVGKPADTPR